MNRPTKRHRFLEQSTLAGVGSWVAGGLARSGPAAARSVKVKATICAGSTPSSIRVDTLREIASVFPAPAQAMT
jgi:hypothetical protein